MRGSLYHKCIYPSYTTVGNVFFIRTKQFYVLYFILLKQIR